MYPLILAGIVTAVYMMSKNNQKNSGANVTAPADSKVTTGEANTAGMMIMPDGTPRYLADLPRGIRNNNPLNIKVSTSNWLGKIPLEQNTDANRTFEQFKEPEYGIRAAARILQTYKTKYGLNTIEGVIKRFAPVTENKTDKYIEFVAKEAGISKGDTIREEHYPIVLGAMIRMENGINPYDQDFIVKASAMA